MSQDVLFFSHAGFNRHHNDWTLDEPRHSLLEHVIVCVCIYVCGGVLDGVTEPRLPYQTPAATIRHTKLCSATVLWKATAKE